MVIKRHFNPGIRRTAAAAVRSSEQLVETTEQVLAEHDRSLRRLVDRRSPVVAEPRNQLGTAVVDRRRLAAGAAGHTELESAEPRSVQQAVGLAEVAFLRTVGSRRTEHLGNQKVEHSVGCTPAELPQSLAGLEPCPYPTVQC